MVREIENDHIIKTPDLVLIYGNINASNMQTLTISKIKKTIFLLFTNQRI